MAVGRGGNRPGAGRSGTGRPGAGGRAGRGPFAVLVMVLLTGGLVALLMLNTALSQGSFTVQKLQRQTTVLTNQQQGLQQQIDGWSAPDALAARARQLGMVPAGNPAFVTDSGKVLGVPSALPAAPSPTPSPTLTQAPATQAPASSSPSSSAVSSSASPSGSGHAAAPHTAGALAARTAAGRPAAHPTPSGH